MEKNILYNNSDESLKTLVANLKTGDFLENASKIKYEVERHEGYVILHELDSIGGRIPDAKKKKLGDEVLVGLIKTKHIWQTSTGRRISHGDTERHLEFNRLTPK